MDSRDIAPRRQARGFWGYVGLVLVAGSVTVAQSLLGLDMADVTAMGAPLLVVVLAGRDDTAVALCMLDLDQFKNVNDTEGHHVGDRVLRLVAERISAVLRPGDVLARLGGDEFAVLIPFAGGSEVALRAADRVSASLQQPMVHDGTSVPLRGSVGVALYPSHGRDYATLMRCADAAMYVAKRNGHGVELHRPARDAPTHAESFPPPGSHKRVAPLAAAPTSAHSPRT